MTVLATSYESLLKVRKGVVDIVDVPEFGFVAVTGTGEPGGAEFIREGQVANRPVYLALGVTVDGERDVLGLWAGGVRLQ
jgi:hypothetical protein